MGKETQYTYQEGEWEGGSEKSFSPPSPFEGITAEKRKKIPLLSLPLHRLHRPPSQAERLAGSNR
ncbi:MAG: hypothetical protein D6812_16465 [Deltaproteobacteria bacterium]|nr:MAG: hypothetical protein D6812_16465 [Deltaproteobacteria bacterium]